MFFKRLVDWISGREPTNARPVAETATDAASSDGSATAGTPAEKRRFLRVALPGAQLSLGRLGPYPLANLSFGGLRALIPSDQQPKVGDEIAARLNLQPSWLAVRLLVRNHHGPEVGFAFVNLGGKESRVLAEFLRPVMIGSSLREITGMSLQAPGPNLRVRWFQGEGGAQIFVWQTLEDEVIKEEFYFLDYVLLWQKEQRGLRIGRLREGVGKVGYGRVDPQTAVFFRAPPYQALRLGQTIMKSATLPAPVRDAMLAEIAAEERRVHRRYLLKDGDAPIRFEPTDHPGQAWRVVNLSLTSIAFLLDELPAADVDRFAAAPQLSGHLLIDDRRVPITLAPRSHRDAILGCRLDLVVPEECERLAEYLAPRLLGQSLEEDPYPCEDLLPQRKGSRPHIYVGVHNTHILALIGPEHRLLAGRIVVLDQVLHFDGSRLRIFTNHGPAILPIERDLPLGQLEEQELRPYLRFLAKNLLASAPAVVDEVRTAWAEILAAPARTH